ncbi:MAG: bacillithiol biosynthesis BshC [Candidatus Eisenbacteria bacterium]|nr:bacillithiol biosynthesis BshC [Candidatus Eisenbacteria bacterium]
MKFLGTSSRAEQGEAWNGAAFDLARRARNGRRVQPELARALGDWNRRLGASPRAMDRLLALEEGRGFTVISGQQPALLGGPLFTLYKLLSTCALAEALEARFSCPVLPIFWLVSDDSDFGEVSSAWLPDADGRAVQIRDEEAPEKGALIGRLAVDRQRRAVTASRAVFDLYPNGAGTRTLLEEALAAGQDWTETVAALLFRLVPDGGFAVIDGAQPALLDAARPFLLEARARWPIEALLEQGASEARARGFEPALERDLAARVLFRLENQRRRGLDPGEDPAAGTVGPNVVLRPVLQDWLFPNLATVCGPSEVRYRAQLGPLYGAADLPEPLRPSRLHAALLPPLGERQVDWEQMVEQPETYVARAVEGALERRYLEAIDATRGSVSASLARLTETLRDLDPSLVQLAESSAGKIDFQVQRLLDGVRGKARHRLGQREPLILALKDWLRPREREQERIFTLSLPHMVEGGEAITALMRGARAEVDRRLDSPLDDECSLVFELDDAPRKGTSG